jgi:TRAP transporter TAXI family solute receptor
MDLASARQIRIVDLTENVPAMRQINPGYTAVQLPANTYPQQTQAVTQIGYMAHLIVGCDQPDDRVYTMVKAIADNLSAMVAIANAMQGVGPRQMAEDIGVPIHPGARRFYREVGALTN